ncbi:tumor necrosis factor ligand superfamily member 10 isoform X2 [Bos indicus]|uniref:Tumor necrosis factor ligand superfamily member n=1 Tax=Bos indicus TaxID=9915 RepID=A0ABM4SJK1_BOSIN|nr:tumor necrosis factor ligand superfamily member 10 isoform X1 [Bos taurus]XP_027396730.1 tumor necrosis factor ligand superfamily member 10 isoform X2 [Bos indicus x Bos taurus]
MALKQAPGSRLGQICMPILIFTVLLQAFGMAVFYMYFNKELKQMQNKYFKSGLACFLEEDDRSWDSRDDESIINPCWELKSQLYLFVKKMTLRTFEEMIPTNPEKQYNPYLEREKGPKRVAAHITGSNRKKSSKNEKAVGHKINSWESSRKGHSFLNNLYLRNGELVILQTGFYYIYSQTYFRFQEPEEVLGTVSTEENRKKIKQMVQYIYKYTNYPDPILLMKSARNSCWSKDSEYGLYSIYQGGIFELKENDRIFVSVTNERLVDLDQEASFFGAFLIG